MAPKTRMSAAKVKVIRALLRDPVKPHWGYDLLKETGLRSGTLYPMLSQLEAMGWVKGKWEFDERVPDGPPRKAYRLTGQGQRVAPRAAEEYLRRRAARGDPVGKTAEAGV